MSQLTPEKIAADIKAARAAAAQTIGRITSPKVPAKSEFSLAVEGAHRKPAVVYQGHAGEGGLQAHSVGGLYPWIIVGFGDGTFSVMNGAAGQQLSARFRDYDEAAARAERLKAGEPFEVVDWRLNE